MLAGIEIMRQEMEFGFCGFHDCFVVVRYNYEMVLIFVLFLFLRSVICITLLLSQNDLG